jgi:hypothetical protein
MTMMYKVLTSVTSTFNGQSLFEYTYQQGRLSGSVL